MRPVKKLIIEKRPEWQDSDFPDAEGRFAELSPKDLAAWLIKTRKKDLKAISGSLTQQVVFNRNEDPKYAEKMEKTRKEVYKQLGRQDLLDKMDENKQTTMKHIKLFEQYITEARDSDYEMIVDLMLKAKPNHNVYYNSDWNVVNIGGTGYDKGDLVKQFGARPGSSSDIKSAFYRAAQSPEETKKAVEKLSKGKIEVEISKSLVIYKIK